MFHAALTRFGVAIPSRLDREEKGATAVEYGLIVGLIAVAIIAGLVFLAPAITDLFTGIAGELDGAQP